VLLSATAADLPADVARALAHPPSGESGRVDVDGTSWGFLRWGSSSDRPLLLVHGVTSNGGIWWRVGPALAAAGRNVVAIDMPGHGRTPWLGRHRLADTASDVATAIRAMGLESPELEVVGHSWGAMVSAHLPIAGIRPSVIVLVDPPHLTVAQLEALTEQADERPYERLDEAVVAVRTANPSWSEGDVAAKARALTEFSAAAVLAVLIQNGDYDAGIAALRRGGAADAVWLIRGEWDTGGLIPEGAVPAIEAQLGADHVITIAGGPHSPQRTHPEATVLAILRALGVAAAVAPPGDR